MGRGTFGGEFGARHCNQWGLYGVGVRQCRDAALFPNYYVQTCCYYRRGNCCRRVEVSCETATRRTTTTKRSATMTPPPPPCSLTNTMSSVRWTCCATLRTEMSPGKKSPGFAHFAECSCTEAMPKDYCLLGRPTYMSGRRTYILLGFFLSFFFHPVISKLAERNSTISRGHMLMFGSECNLKMHSKIWRRPIPSPLQIDGPKTTFLTISQLKGNFNGICLRNETRYTQADKCIANDKESSISSTV